LGGAHVDDAAGHVGALEVAAEDAEGVSVVAVHRAVEHAGDRSAA
jgi:hypothetical protein